MILTQTIKVPLYGQEFILLLWDNVDQVMEKFQCEDVYLYQGCVTDYDGDRYIIFNVQSVDGIEYPTPGLIAHECKHVVNRVFLEVGHKLDRNNDEPECYLLSWIVNTVHHFLHQHRAIFECDSEATWN